MSTQTEEEQIAQLKDWWQRNGKPILTGGVLALAVVLGWNAWQKYTTAQSANASVLYQQLLETALSAEDKDNSAEVVELADKLKSEYGSSQYAQYARLFVARAAVDAGKFDDAAAELQAVVDKPVSAELGELARQRLARVLYAQGKSEQGLELLQGEVDKAYLASREEIRGDLLLDLGRRDEAREAYAKAKEALGESGSTAAVQIKLDDLTGEK